MQQGTASFSVISLTLPLSNDDEIFKKGHLGKDPDDLIRSAHAFTGNLVGPLPRNFFSFEIDVSGVRLKHPGDEIEKGRLPVISTLYSTFSSKRFFMTYDLLFLGFSCPRSVPPF